MTQPRPSSVDTALSVVTSCLNERNHKTYIPPPKQQGSPMSVPLYPQELHSWAVAAAYQSPDGTAAPKCRSLGAFVGISVPRTSLLAWDLV